MASICAGALLIAGCSIETQPDNEDRQASADDNSQDDVSAADSNRPGIKVDLPGIHADVDTNATGVRVDSNGVAVKVDGRDVEARVRGGENPSVSVTANRH